MPNEFKHHQSAHCENGVATSLLKYHGMDFMSEPLVFGMGSGLFYIHIPFLMINGRPAVSYRSMPGWIFSRASKLLGLSVTRKKFSNETKAKEFLDQKIKEGIPVGCQVGVFNLPYFPAEYRFHFNAHNLIVYGKEGNDYLVSDPVMEGVTKLSEEDMMKVRFAKGPFAPNGHIYFPENIKNVSEETIRKAIVKGIKRNSRDMLHVPGPIAGVSGINFTAKHIRKWREKLGAKKAALYLGQIVRMQEEIGTGGGGFRFIYAAFLEQSAGLLKEDKLTLISDEFTKAGDLWRASAVQMGRIYKGRLDEQKYYEECADMLNQISSIEKEAFKKLLKMDLKY
ncbi:MAG: BtrH N-terminal domain-containing protein [Sphingobacteriaceae bacterium]|nr:BtrH N-terminal domain-containing protein [Sphingobacteriaceae bacterium]